MFNIHISITMTKTKRKMHFQNRKDSDTHMHTANTIKTIIKRTKKDLKFYKYDNGNPRIRIRTRIQILLLLHRRLLQIAEDVAHLVQIGWRRVRIPDPHDIGLLVGTRQGLEVARILGLLVLQLGVVARVEEDAVSPVVKGLLPLGHVLHCALGNSVQQIGQFQPVRI